MQKHAHACNNSYQVLTLAFDGQVEGTPGTCYAPYLTKDTSAFKLGPRNYPPDVGSDTPVGPRHALPGWQLGQLNDERFMNESRRIGVPHLLQGCPARP